MGAEDWSDPPPAPGTSSLPSTLMSALTDVFGHRTLRPGQSDVIRHVVAGRPTLAVMATGAGKSLCYQLPAVVLDGLTLVVSPLVALIRDQVGRLGRLNVRAASLTSADPFEERARTEAAVRAGRLALLFVAPERFRSRRFQALLRGVRLSLFVVDEAHCISQWGHDFRPEYGRLGEVVDALRPARLLALTATATERVRTDIVQRLHFVDPIQLVTGFDRENLELSVIETTRAHKASAARKVLARWLRGGGSGIVYVATRAAAERFAEQLVADRFRAAAYHAGLEPRARADVQGAFETGGCRVVVATSAFGMGIDKADVRVVVHYHLPDTPEAYYQEVGRAGRDGAPAAGVLLFDRSDFRYVLARHEASCPTLAAVADVYAAARGHAGSSLGLDDLEEAIRSTGGPATRAALVALERARDIELHGPELIVHPGGPRVDPETLDRRAREHRARLDAMMGYVLRASCRRRFLVDYFGDPRRPERCGVCDRCRAPEDRPVVGAELEAAQMALSCVARMRGRYGKSRVAEVLRGSQSKVVMKAGLHRLSTHGLLSSWSQRAVLDLLDALVRADLARVDGAEYPKLTLTGAGADALRTRAPLRLPWPGSPV